MQIWPKLGINQLPKETTNGLGSLDFWAFSTETKKTLLAMVELRAELMKLETTTKS